MVVGVPGLGAQEKSRLKSRMGGIWVLGDQLEIWDTWVLESEPEATFGGNLGRGTWSHEWCQGSQRVGSGGPGRSRTALGVEAIPSDGEQLQLLNPDLQFAQLLGVGGRDEPGGGGARGQRRGSHLGPRRRRVEEAQRLVGDGGQARGPGRGAGTLAGGTQARGRRQGHRRRGRLGQGPAPRRPARLQRYKELLPDVEVAERGRGDPAVVEGREIEGRGWPLAHRGALAAAPPLRHLLNGRLRGRNPAPGDPRRPRVAGF